MEWTKAAAGLVVFLWIVFYTVRWIAALREENKKCDPPLPDAEVEQIARNAARQPDRDDFNGMPTIGPEPPGGEPAAGTTKPDSDVPRLRPPAEAYMGLAREFADLYSEYLESPRSFFYFAFLTYFGAVVSKMVTLASALPVQPRLYTVLLGESADTRKSTALGKVDEFFEELRGELTLKWQTLHGVGSAEGLAQAINEAKKEAGGTGVPFLLHFDELKAFVQKGKIDSSVLLPMVNTLFERGDYDNVTKRTKDGGGRVSVHDASLSLLAASTIDTYATMFSQQFTAIGFPNRLWLVADRTDKHFAVPRKIPDAAVQAFRATVIKLLRDIHAAYVQNGNRPVEYTITPGALRLFEEWYAQREGSIFERRLDTYGHRLALLLAVTSGKTEVDEEVMAATVALLRWQLDVRRECDPVDAETTIAQLEERMRRALVREPLTGSQLKRKLNYKRYGIGTWDIALRNLCREEVTLDPATKRYALKPTSLAASAGFSV